MTGQLRLILLSGPVAGGKTTLRDKLVSDFGFLAVQSSVYLKSLAKLSGIGIDRCSLQELGDSLDVQTDYRWLVDDVALPQITANPRQFFWLVDAVRKPEQVKHFREAFSEAVIHIHLTCPEAILEERYISRLGTTLTDDTISYTDAVRHPNEVSARKLVEIADITIDTNLVDIESAAQTAIYGLSRAMHD